jgi:hypothetical protein
MEKSAINSLITQGLSLRQISRLLNTSPTNARYWIRKHRLELQQRPFGKGYVPQDTLYRCGQCGETDPAKFYGHKRKVCGPCHNAYNIKQGLDRRLRAVNELGGKCQVCGFDRYSCSLDLHHREAKAKSPNFRSMRGWSWGRILVELQKCVLLCKNCHAATHAGFLQI